MFATTSYCDTTTSYWNRMSSNVLVDQESSTLPPSSPENSVSFPQVMKSEFVSIKLPGERRNSSRQRTVVSKDTFVTFNAETGRHEARFRILPYSRELNQKYSGATDKLSVFIKRGGGLVVEGLDREGPLSPRDQDVIKILDVEYVRANIQETQDMLLPYDCFSSSFIWNQIYQRSNNMGKKDADLNLFRVSPSAHVSHDANGIFQGAVTWNDIQPIPSEKLSPAIRIKEVALHIFPELIVCPSSRSGSSLKSRRVYSRQESQMLLDKVCEVNGHDRINGISLYKEIAETFDINRTTPSLKEHFLKTVLPHVITGDDYYTITPADSAKFKMLHGKRGRKQQGNNRKSAKKGP